jgi:hypothetical protein
MRATRLARAEVIKAGQIGYAEAVSEYIGDDNQFVWPIRDRCQSLPPNA